MRYVPSAPFAVLIETAVAGALDPLEDVVGVGAAVLAPLEDVVGVGAAVLAVELELLLPHAATSNDTLPTARRWWLCETLFDSSSSRSHFAVRLGRLVRRHHCKRRRRWPDPSRVVF